MTTTAEAFASRLRQALDHARFTGGRPRTSALAQHFNVSRETARKWLAAMTLPELERIIEMARDFHVSFEWLATGRGPMTLPEQTSMAEQRAVYSADPERATLLAVVSSLPDAKRKALLELLRD